MDLRPASEANCTGMFQYITHQTLITILINKNLPLHPILSNISLVTNSNP